MQYIEQTIHANISVKIVINHIRPGSLMLSLARVESIWSEVHKSKTSRHIFSKLFTHIHKPFSTHLIENKNNNKKNFYSISSIEYKLRRAYNFFVILGRFDALHRKKVKMQKKITGNYFAWEKEKKINSLTTNVPII